MEQFHLESQIILFENGQANTRLFPTNLGLIDKIETFKIYESEQDALSDLDTFLREMLPIMYNNLDEETKQNYYL
jgi:hypothetical protein